MSRKLCLAFILFLVFFGLSYAKNLSKDSALYYDNLIKQAKESNKPDTTLGRIYLEAQNNVYLSDMKKAINYLHEAEKIYERLDDRKTLTSVYYNLGRDYQQLQLFQTSLDYLTKAHNLNIELDNYSGTAYTNCDIGNVFFAFNQFNVAETYYRSSLALFEKHDDTYGMAVMYNNLGLCKMSLNMPDSALVYFKVGYNLRVKQKDKFVIDHSINYLGTAYAAMHEYPKAIAYYTKVINDIDSWPDASQKAIQLKADVLFNLRNLYQDMKSPFLANKYLEEALVTYNQINDTAGTIKALLAMANDEFADKDYSNAIQHGEAAYLLSDTKDLISTSQKISGFLTKVYIQTSNTEKAQKYLSINTALSDSVMNQYSSSGLTQTHAAIQTFSKDLENQTLRIREKLTTRFLIIIAILLLIVMFMYFYVLFTKRSSIKNLKSLADASFESIVIHDAGRILEVNDRLCKISGYERHELIDHHLADLKCLEITDDIRKAMQSNSDAVYETRVIAKDGRTEEVEIISKPFIYKNKHVRVVAMREITERKRYTNELVKTNEQNKKLIATKDKLFSIIAHDLKNPFNAIIGLSSLVKRDIDKLDKEELLDMISMIHDSSQYAHGLLDNLLEWALIQTGALQFKPSKINLYEQLKPILAITSSNASAKKLEINTEIEQELYIFADSRMLRTILLNLISNAIKFTPRKGMINIKSYKQGNSTRIEIRDNGIGIEPNVVTRLFDIDNMVSSKGTDNEQGTGLGLILCHELILRHNGKLDITSIPGQGTTFSITLPDVAE